MAEEKPVHIVGAGLAGLAAGLTLSAAGRPVVLHEATAQAGGRCRSYADAVIGRRIDNGNHLIVSANETALAYLKEIGAREEMIEVRPARYPFVYIADGHGWDLEVPALSKPWTWFCGKPPMTSRLRLLRDMISLLRARPQDSLSDVLGRSSAWESLWRPLGVSALNTEAEAASATLFGKTVRATLLKGETASRPLIARRGLGEALIDPAIATLAGRGVEIRFNSRIKELDPDKPWIVAVPPAAAHDLLPHEVPAMEARPIVNAHFRVSAVAPDAVFKAIVGGASEWVFHRGDVVSITISAAQRFLEEPQAQLLDRLWQEARQALGLAETDPLARRLLVEKRATFAQTPEQLAKRPGCVTAKPNVFLAGDYTDTGLPATIEGAILSGRRAAGALLQRA